MITAPLLKSRMICFSRPDLTHGVVGAVFVTMLDICVLTALSGLILKKSTQGLHGCGKNQSDVEDGRFASGSSKSPWFLFMELRSGKSTKSNGATPPNLLRQRGS